MKKKVIIVGAFHEIVELCQDNDYLIVGIIDNNIKGYYLNYPILGCDNDAKSLFKVYSEFPLVITPDSPKIRNKLYNLYSSIGFTFATIISRKANISPSATIGSGTIIQFGVNVSSFACVGNFVKLNTNANVMHDSKIGDFTTVAPNAVVLGGVKINSNVYIGANSTILPHIQVQAHATIGAGAVVTKDIADSCTYTGIPARKM